MHEVGLMQATLDLALEHAARHQATAILRLGLRVGALSGVVPDALQFAFDALRSGTIAADARLEIEELPAECYCAVCGRVFSPPDVIYACPICGRPSADVRRGRELELAFVEVT